MGQHISGYGGPGGDDIHYASPTRGQLEQLPAVSWRRHGQKGFHMDDDADLYRQILHIKAHIEELADVIERCRKIILISKAAIAAGGALILAIIIGAVGFDPTVMIGAIAGVIGGIVVFGSNTTTLKQTKNDMKAAVAHRAELINRLDRRVVDGEIEVNEMGSSGSGHQSF
jgi:hypothetical protein